VTTIRFLAQELYRLTRKVEELERALKNAPLGEQAPLEAELFQARRDLEHYRSLLAAKKEKPIV
jgi:Mg-chelatase subunit ChlD